MTISVFTKILDALKTNDPTQKVEKTNQLYQNWLDEAYVLEPSAVKTITVPGRPDKPELVAPKNLSKRKLNSDIGIAALLHSIAHIEFNAINLALDAAYRFQDMPKDYYTDWIRIAVEESHHFSLIREHMASYGYQYGDFLAHNGLWEMALETDYDVLVRMALVPRILEARGLDVNPAIQDKLSSIGEKRAVEILQIIERDEIGHVACGNHWYRYLCEQRELDPLETFKGLLKKHAVRTLRGPFAVENRLKAGFTQTEMDWLQTEVGELVT